MSSLPVALEGLLASAEAQSVRFRAALLDSEAQRMQLQQKLTAAESKITPLLTRVVDAEMQARIVSERAQVLEKQLAATESRAALSEERERNVRKLFDDSKELLRVQEQQREESDFEHRSQLESLQEELRLMRVTKTILQDQSAQQFDAQGRIRLLEKQGRLLQATIDECQAKVEVQGAELADTQSQLLLARRDAEESARRLHTLDKLYQSAQRALLHEQERGRQMEAALLTYRKQTSSAAAHPSASDASLLRLVGGVADDSNSATQNGVANTPDQVLDEAVLATNLPLLEVQRLDVENASLKKQNSCLSSSERSLTQQLEQSERRLSSVTAAHDALAQELRGLRNESRACASAAHQKDTEIASLKREAIALQRAAEASSELLKSAEATRAAAEQLLLREKHEKAGLQRRVVELEDQLNGLRASTSSMTLHLEQTSHRLRQCTAEREGLEARCDELSRALEQEKQTALEVAHRHTAAEQLLEAAHASVAVVMASLLDAECIADQSAKEAENLRRQNRSVVGDYATMERSRNFLKEQLEQSTEAVGKMKRSVHEAGVDALRAQEEQSRMRVRCSSLEELVENLQNELANCRSVLECSRALAAPLSQAYEIASARLHVLTGEVSDESFDDLLHYVNDAATSLKTASREAASLPPPGSTVAWTIKQAFGLSAVVVGQLPSAFDCMWNEYDIGASGAARIRGGGGGLTTAGRGSSAGYGGVAHLLLLEYASRATIYAQEAESSRQLLRRLVTVLAEQIDSGEVAQRVSLQVQIANDRAAALLRAVKWLGLKHHRKAHALSHYQQLEQTNAKLLRVAQVLQDVYWTILDSRLDPDLRAVTRSRLLQLPEMQQPSDARPSSMLQSLLDGDVLGQLQFENERLAEDASRTAKHVAQVEQLNASLCRKILATERRWEASCHAAAFQESRQPRGTHDHHQGDASGDGDDYPPLSNTAASTRPAPIPQSADWVPGVQASFSATLSYVTTFFDEHERLERHVNWLTAVRHSLEWMSRRVFQLSHDQLEWMHFSLLNEILDAHVAASLNAAHAAAVSATEQQHWKWLLQSKQLASTTRSTETISSASEAASTQTDVVDWSSLSGSRGVGFSDTGGDGDRPAALHARAVVTVSSEEARERAQLALDGVESLNSILHAALSERTLVLSGILLKEVAKAQRAHDFHTGELQVDHKHQVLGYAKTMEDFNRRLQAAVKGRSEIEAEASRMRNECKRLNEAAREHAQQNIALELEVAQLRTLLVDLQEHRRLDQREMSALRHRCSALEHSERALQSTIRGFASPETAEASSLVVKPIVASTTGPPPACAEAATQTTSPTIASSHTPATGGSPHIHLVAKADSATGWHRSLGAVSQSASQFSPFIADFIDQGLAEATPGALRHSDSERRGMVAAVERGRSAVITADNAPFIADKQERGVVAPQRTYLFGQPLSGKSPPPPQRGRHVATDAASLVLPIPSMASASSATLLEDELRELLGEATQRYLRDEYDLRVANEHIAVLHHIATQATRSRKEMRSQLASWEETWMSIEDYQVRHPRPRALTATAAM